MSEKKREVVIDMSEKVLDMRLTSFADLWRRFENVEPRPEVVKWLEDELQKRKGSHV